MNNKSHTELIVSCEPQFARLVRMTAANVAALCSMSLDRVEDVRMGAEEAFIYACLSAPNKDARIAFDVENNDLSITCSLESPCFSAPTEDDPSATYADLILGSVCDAYEKHENPACLTLLFKADVDAI